MNADLLSFELRRTRTTAGPDREALNRAAYDADRRRTRRHRLAQRVRSVADRLEA